MMFDWCRAVRVAAWATALSLGVTAAWAQDPAPAAAAAQNEGAELAKKLSNPIADLVSVPFQFNWAQGVGPDDGTRFILNIQPRHAVLAEQGLEHDHPGDRADHRPAKPGPWRCSRLRRR